VAICTLYLLQAFLLVFSFYLFSWNFVYLQVINLVASYPPWILFYTLAPHLRVKYYYLVVSCLPIPESHSFSPIFVPSTDPSFFTFIDPSSGSSAYHSFSPSFVPGLVSPTKRPTARVLGHEQPPGTIVEDCVDMDGTRRYDSKEVRNCPVDCKRAKSKIFDQTAGSA
jgi:hypothetical protein